MVKIRFRRASRPPKPKTLGDINITSPSRRRDNFSQVSDRINLSYERVVRLPVTKSARIAIYVASLLFLFLGSVTAPTIFTRASTTSAPPASDAERQALESQLSDLEGQINQYEGQISGYQAQGKNLKGEIAILNGKIAKLNLQIKAINLTLKQINKNIADTQDQITVTENSITTRKAALGQLLQGLYANERVSLVEVFLANPRLSDFFNDLNNITLLQSNLRVAVEQIVDLRSQLKDKQDQFLLAKSDAQKVQEYQMTQQDQIASTTLEKAQLLAVTKGQETKYQALLQQTKATAAQIRSRIFQLLGGGQLSFEDAYQYAKLAGSATGIRPALLLAVLDRESALGQNVGRCSYKTAMSPSNQVLFLALTAQLNINPDVVTVSCPNRDGVYGGAMGPAQFVPATWNLYTNAVSKVTGHTPASPWNNADAFVATALYLRDSMQGCSAVYSAQTSQERCVAAKYYAGSRWRSYLWTYGEAVVNQAKSFQDDIDTITG